MNFIFLQNVLSQFILWHSYWKESVHALSKAELTVYQAWLSLNGLHNSWTSWAFLMAGMLGLFFPISLTKPVIFITILSLSPTWTISTESERSILWKNWSIGMDNMVALDKGTCKYLVWNCQCWGFLPTCFPDLYLNIVWCPSYLALEACFLYVYSTFDRLIYLCMVTFW